MHKENYNENFIKVVYILCFYFMCLGTRLYSLIHRCDNSLSLQTLCFCSIKISINLNRPLPFPFPYFFISFLFYITFYSSQFKSPTSMRFTQTVVFLCIATGNAIGVSSITTARWKNITFFHIRKISHRTRLMLQKIWYRC